MKKATTTSILASAASLFVGIGASCAGAMAPAVTFTDGEYTATQSGCRLDRALREHLPGASWNAVRRIIRSGKVRLNGEVSRHPSKLVAAGARLRIPMAAPKRRPPPQVAALPDKAILFVDPHIAVVNKPANMVTIVDEHHPVGSLEQLVAGKLSRRGRQSMVPFVVQRLDFATSGLVVFARTREALHTLKPQFKARTVRRRYLALVAGKARTTRYESYLTEHRDGKRKSTAHKHLGKRAVTHVEVVQRLRGATLIHCRLETGRTHQIRIHLSEAGHPLLGDERYARHYVQAPVAPRMMLHAETLGFEHPNGEPMDFSQSPPADFLQLLKALR